jgi:IS30 family transposase
MAHKQLGENERFVIELMLSKKSTASEIARFLGCSRQTVSREIKRNINKDNVYSAERAQNMYLARRTYPKQDSKLAKLTDENLKFIVTELKKRSSP